MSAVAAVERWVRGGLARQYAWAQCRYCGRSQAHDCAPVDCLLCGTRQCHGNGGGNGCCAVCHHGYLPGWSRPTYDARHCGYKGCDDEAVGVARNRPICAGHAERAKVSGGLTLAEHVVKRLAIRDAGSGWERWRLVA